MKSLLSRHNYDNACLGGLMYIAELRGKLSSRVECSEDILTSNVFSFFKYANREIFLKRYLANLGFDITTEEAINAQFIFWPVFEDGTVRGRCDCLGGCTASPQVDAPTRS